MMTTARLRDAAERCRRLARGIGDPLTTTLLAALAEGADQASSLGATAMPLRPAFFRPASTSQNCPSLNMRLARNCRNHSEPSEPTATSIGTAPPGEVECHPATSARVGIAESGVSPPSVPVATNHAAGCRADGQLAVRREGERTYRADDDVTRLRHPAPPPVVRTQDSEIGADQQVGRIAWIDRDDERCVEKQANIRIQPGGAEIAGAKHAAIAACIMRRRAAGQEGHHAGKPKGQPTHAVWFFSNPRMRRVGVGTLVPPRKHRSWLARFFTRR
jgi:hypothetical protein